MDDLTLAHFMSRIRVQPDGCWRWMNKPDKDGYGMFGHKRITRRAHRVAYEHFVGPIPDGLELDHLCHTQDKDCTGIGGCEHRRCVNPSHLEPVTRLENSLRGGGPTAENRLKTHCPQDHEYVPANTYVDKLGKRYCKECHRATNREYARRKAAAKRAARIAA